MAKRPTGRASSAGSPLHLLGQAGAPSGDGPVSLVQLDPHLVEGPLEPPADGPLGAAQPPSNLGRVAALEVPEVPDLPHGLARAATARHGLLEGELLDDLLGLRALLP
jgi:hypothetical protein